MTPQALQEAARKACPLRRLLGRNHIGGETAGFEKHDESECTTCALIVSAIERAVSDRDLEWYNRAQRYFPEIQPVAALLDTFKDLADAVIHETWKRNPDVERAVAEERKRCALVALADPGETPDSYSHPGARIAAAIRNGPTK